MLPIKRRLRNESFDKVMKEGVFVHSDNLYIRFIDRKDNQTSLFSFIVPIRTKKTSVGRHLIKRRVSSVVEKALQDIKPGFSSLIFVKKDISPTPYFKIEEEVLELLKKTKILS